MTWSPHPNSLILLTCPPNDLFWFRAFDPSSGSVLHMSMPVLKPIWLQLPMPLLQSKPTQTARFWDLQCYTMKFILPCCCPFRSTNQRERAVIKYFVRYSAVQSLVTRCYHHRTERQLWLKSDYVSSILSVLCLRQYKTLGVYLITTTTRSFVHKLWIR